MPEALERIARLRALLPRDVRVQVDGGINRETARAAREAGADLLVAGSAVFWRDDPATAYRELVADGRGCLSRCWRSASPRGAFERIEEWLREHGLFEPGREGLVADVYLGYGLSQAIRRRCVAAPTEPCPALPLAACRIVREPVQTVEASRGPFRIGDWERDVDGLRSTARRSTRCGARSRAVTSTRSTSSSTSRRRSRAILARSRARLAAAAAAPPRAVLGRGLGRRVRVARALPRAARQTALDDADQGHATARRRGRAPCVGEGRGRARDDRRPRAQRPLARVRGGHRALAGAHGDPRAGRASSTWSRPSRGRCARASGFAEILRGDVSRAGP